jgi:hypothetical protein
MQLYKFFFLYVFYKMSETDNIFEVCMSELREKVEGIEINADTIIEILKYAMEVVELSKAKGKAQRDLAIKLVRKLIVDAPIADEKEKLLLDLIDNGILANTVELVVDASKGEVDVNSAAKVAVGCCAAFLKKR